MSSVERVGAAEGAARRHARAAESTAEARRPAAASRAMSCLMLYHWQRRTGRTPAPDLFEPFVWAFMGKGRELGAPEYLLFVQDFQAISREIARFFVDHDVWLTPTLGEPPVPLGTFRFDGGDPFEVRRRMAAFTPFTYVANVTGQPAMSVPTYWTEAGLPLGTHWMGRFGDEATLFRLAAQLETARPWSGRRPPVWAG